jgi:hypothetical protein
MAKTYQVTLPKNFVGPQHSRAGVSVLPGPDGYVGELTDDQLKAIKADELFTVKTVGTSAGQARSTSTTDRAEHTPIEADGQELVPEQPTTEGIAEEAPDAPAEPPAEAPAPKKSKK